MTWDFAGITVLTSKRGLLTASSGGAGSGNGSETSSDGTGVTTAAVGPPFAVPPPPPPPPPPAAPPVSAGGAAAAVKVTESEAVESGWPEFTCSQLALVTYDPVGCELGTFIEVVLVMLCWGLVSCDVCF